MPGSLADLSLITSLMNIPEFLLAEAAKVRRISFKESYVSG